jgi:hypothetical protein
MAGLAMWLVELAVSEDVSLYVRAGIITAPIPFMQATQSGFASQAEQV